MNNEVASVLIFKCLSYSLPACLVVEIVEGGGGGGGILGGVAAVLVVV